MLCSKALITALHKNRKNGERHGEPGTKNVYQGAAYHKIGAGEENLLPKQVPAAKTPYVLEQRLLYAAPY